MSIRFKLSAELVDGEHWAVVDSKEEVIEAINNWFSNFEICPTIGKYWKVATVEMSQQEVESLPDI
jgi:sulfur relay (sulfurtransferase) DsrC/TusE family protein